MVEPLPTSIPIWNTGGSNRTEPLAGEKVTGWSLNDEPPSSYFNWLQYYTGAWLTWLSERLTKGSQERDVVLQSLSPTAPGNGGQLDLAAAAANGSNTGGDANLTTANQTAGACGDINIDAGTGSAPGPAAGGQVTIIAGNSYTQAAGRVTIQGGNQTDVASGLKGGDMRLWAGDTSGTGVGGEVELYGGDSTSGPGGSIEIFAGDGGNGNEGGDVSIAGGDSVDVHAGDVNIDGGDASGTDRQGGNVEIKTGTGTGTNGSWVDFYVSEAEAGGSGSGTYDNTPELYLSIHGGTSSKHVKASRYLEVVNAIADDPARGVVKLNPKTRPTAGTHGDIYPDSTVNRMRAHDGTGYRNLASFFGHGGFTSDYADDAVTERGFVIGATPVKVDVPASHLSAGSLVRIFAQFQRIGTLTDEPGIRIRAGTHATASPGGVVLFQIDPKGGGNSLELFTIIANIYVVSAGNPGSAEGHGFAIANTVLTATWGAGQQASSRQAAIALPTTIAQEWFPTVRWQGTGAGQSMRCNHFLVDII